nr:NepR family anti-sigma factor [Methylobacterium sp. UNC378MF]
MPSDRPRLRSGLSDQTRNRIAVQLRAMYDTVTQQPVPDRFADLIAKLDSADRKA